MSHSNTDTGSATLWIIIAVVATILIGIFLLNNGDDETADAPKGKVVSETGVHWDPEVSIYIKGQKQEIPANLGLTNGHNPIHTHDNKGTIHWEFENGPIIEEQVMLGSFFRLWNKPFSSTQILDRQNGPEGKVSMTVNGQPNNEFDTYQIQDKDKIELRYE